MGKSIVISIMLSVVALSAAAAQEESKHELRSTWIATVANIDWPKYEHREKPDQQKQDLLEMLDLYRSMNLNAIFLQVRPECDALYQSAYEPWSRFLTWNQGTDPGYDPLQFALEEAHKRGIEMHVWLNPYRINASTSDGEDYYHSTHIYSEHPEWAIEYVSGKKILNPGRPEVMSYIGSIVRDIVLNYQVDGVHFDDYFYAYEGTPSVLDANEFETYGGGMSRDDWRRDNVNRMIDTVYKVIQEVNPSIRFGVSPFGIYRDGVPPGIIGFDAYNTIYCDPLAWLRAGSVDYITPQIYWPTGGAQDFETLVNWWADSCFRYERHLFPGHGTYKLPDNPGVKKSAPYDALLHESKYYMELHLSQHEMQILKGTGDPAAPWTLGQIGTQIDIIRSNREKNGLGSLFFSAKDFTRVSGLAEYLRGDKYTHPALIPEMGWKPDDTPGTPQNLRSEIIGDEYHMAWDHAFSGNERVAIYVSDVESDTTVIIQEPSNLQEIVFGNTVPLSALVITPNSTITATVVSETGREGIPSSPLTLDETVPFVELITPADGDTVGQAHLFQWQSDFTDPQYQIQIATNATFSNIIYTSGWTTHNSMSIDSAGLKGESNYFWRVRGSDGVAGPYSGAGSFVSGYPEVPEFLSPENLDQNVSTRPTFRWSASGITENAVVQISESSTFFPVVAEASFDASAGQGTLSLQLEKDTWYYARLQGNNSYGSSPYTGFVTFKTSAGDLPDVQIISPEDLDTVASFDKLRWETTTTEGTITYQLEVAMDEAFSGTIYRSEWISENELLISEMNLEGKRSYFWRVKGKSEFGEGEFSISPSFFTGYPTRPSITQPLHLSEGINAKPLIGWNVDDDTDSVFVEFSEESDFSTLTHSETFAAVPDTASISASLRGFTWYYLHIRAENKFGRGVASAKKYFMTGEGTDIQLIMLNQQQLLVYPTPFTNGTLYIRYTLSEPEHLNLKIFDQMGRQIYQELVSSSPGELSVDIGIKRDLFPTPGVYFIQLSNNRICGIESIIVH
ncbi:MAG: family 10 glycosylhydrolase [Bacteroidota bacterium]